MLSVRTVALLTLAASEPRGRRDLLLEEEDLVVEVGFGLAFHTVEQEELIVELHQGVASTTSRRGLGDGTRGDAAPEPQHMVPDDLDPFFRNRERNTVDRTGHAVTAFCQLGTDRGGLGGIIDTLWHCRTTMGRVNIHLVRRVGFQHLLLTCGQLVGVLSHVVGRYGEEGFVVGERVRVVHTFYYSKPTLTRILNLAGLEPVVEELDEALAEILERAFAGRTAEAWLAEMDRRGVPSAPITSWRRS